MSMDSVNDRLQDAAEDDRYEGSTIAFVEVNEDPEGLGRIKVRIPQSYDPDQGPIPWVLPTRYSPFGQGVGYGVYGSPKIDSGVRVSFQNGDPHCPVLESAEYLKAFANPKFKSPDTWGFKDCGGSELFVNMNTGAWEFTHQSGSTIKYDANGNVHIEVKKDLDTKVDGNQTNEVTGNDTQTVGGDSSSTVSGNLNFTVTGNITMSATGSVNISGSSVNLN